MYKHIMFDFDGVLAESNQIRVEGFRLLFGDYPEGQVRRLVRFAKANGGLSRYQKIRYFFEDIRNEFVSNCEVEGWAKRYSEIVKQKVINSKPVTGVTEFLSEFSDILDLAIVSGSDQGELREICSARRIDHFFVKILGSPASKEENICRLLSKGTWDRTCSLFVGDSINDLDAAMAAGIDFIGRNSGLVDWSTMPGAIWIRDIHDLPQYL